MEIFVFILVMMVIILSALVAVACILAGGRAQAGTVKSAVAASDVALLGVGEFRRGTETTVQADLMGELNGARVSAAVKPVKMGPTRIKVSLSDLKQVSGDTRYILWAVSPDTTYTRLGKLKIKARRGEAGLETKTFLREFGLILTIEPMAKPAFPSGAVVATFAR